MQLADAVPTKPFDQDKHEQTVEALIAKHNANPVKMLTIILALAKGGVNRNAETARHLRILAEHIEATPEASRGGYYEADEADELGEILKTVQKETEQ